jgi:hypothetical protein
MMVEGVGARRVEQSAASINVREASRWAANLWWRHGGRAACCPGFCLLLVSKRFASV